MAVWVGFALSALGSLAAGGCGPGAGETSGSDAFVSVDSVRILEDLRTLSHDSMQGRRTGEPGNILARDYILAAFREAGLLEPPAGFVQPFEFRGRGDPTRMIQGANVVGYVPGADSTLGAVVLTAHFDHVGIRDGEVYNGADDNASGTAALLSAARLMAEHPTHHTLVFAALDAEEMGLRGARAFVEAGWPPEIILNVNLDMVARSDSVLYAVGTHHYPFLRPILEGVEERGPVVIRFGHDEPGVEGVADWTGSSDHAAFHRAGIPFVYFGVDDHEDYHQPTDDFDRVDPGFYLNSVRTILAGVLALDEGLEGVPNSGPNG